MDGEFIVRVCRSCGAAGSQRPNGSYLCLKCDPTITYQEFISLVREGKVSDDLYLQPGTGGRPPATVIEHAA